MFVCMKARFDTLGVSSFAQPLSCLGSATTTSITLRLSTSASRAQRLSTCRGHSVARALTAGMRCTALVVPSTGSTIKVGSSVTL